MNVLLNRFSVGILCLALSAALCGQGPSVAEAREAPGEAATSGYGVPPSEGLDLPRYAPDCP